MTLLRAATPLLLVCFSITPETQSLVENETGIVGVLPDGYIAHPDIGFAYKVYCGFHYFTDWTGAEEFCVRKGGHLAVIDSEKKLKYALHRPKTTRISQYRHVGILKINGQWVSVVDGGVLSSVPWAQDEPDYHPYKDHAIIDVVADGRRLVARSRTYREDFVCQRPLPVAESS